MDKCVNFPSHLLSRPPPPSFHEFLLFQAIYGAAHPMRLSRMIRLAQQRPSRTGALNGPAGLPLSRANYLFSRLSSRCKAFPANRYCGDGGGGGGGRSANNHCLATQVGRPNGHWPSFDWFEECVGVVDGPVGWRRQARAMNSSRRAVDIG